ncbi:hypothetical protein GGI43DRAFT_45482 [Trichoderma evansii]
MMGFLLFSSYAVLGWSKRARLVPETKTEITSCSRMRRWNDGQGITRSLGGMDSLNRVWALRAKKKKKQGRMDMGNSSRLLPKLNRGLFLCSALHKHRGILVSIQGTCYAETQHLRGTSGSWRRKAQGRKHLHVKSQTAFGEENEEWQHVQGHQPIVRLEFMGALRGKSKINHRQSAELEYGVAQRDTLAFYWLGWGSNASSGRLIICPVQLKKPVAEEEA